MSTLREQFEAWYRNQFLYVADSDFKRDKNKPDNYEATKVWDHWDAFQAGHAASGRDELLEACEQCLRHIEQDESTHGRPFAAGNVARAAIKKARGEQ